MNFIKNAFDAQVKCGHPNSDGTLMHSETDIYGQIMMISELVDENAFTGNTVMFCLHFAEGKEDIIQKYCKKTKHDSPRKKTLH